MVFLSVAPDPVTLEAESMCFWGPWACRIRQMACSRLPLTGHCTESKLKHAHYFWGRGLCSCAAALAWRQASGKALSWSYVLSRNGGCGCSIWALTMSCCSSQYLLVGRLYIHLEFWFSDCHPGSTFRSPAVVARSTYLCVPNGLHIFAFFKNPWLRVRDLQSGEWDSTPPPPLGHCRSCHTVSGWS